MSLSVAERIIRIFYAYVLFPSLVFTHISLILTIEVLYIFIMSFCVEKNLLLLKALSYCEFDSLTVKHTIHLIEFFFAVPPFPVSVSL